MRVLSRVAAVVVAVGLVVGALALRPGGDVEPAGDGTADDDDGQELLCARDLGGVCDAVAAAGVRTSPVTTRDVAVGAATDVPGTPWLVPTAWADVVDDERARAGRQPLARSGVVATSPVVLVGYRDRVEAIATSCGVPVAAVTTDCLRDIAGARWADVNGQATWGRVGLAHELPDTTVGLLTTASIASDVAGADFGATDLRDPAVSAALRRIAGSSNASGGIGGPVGSLRTTGPSYADVVVAVEADVVGIEQPRFGPLVVVAPDPTLLVELVVVAADQPTAEAAAAAVTDALDGTDDTGWRTGGAPAGSPLTADVSPAPRPDGPSLVALQRFWDEIVG